METNTDKTLKKRKSLASQNSTPSKVKKTQDGSPKAKTPKSSENLSKASPLLDTSVGIKSKKPKTSLIISVLEKSMKEDSSAESTTKLKKFKGVTSLEEKVKKRRRPYRSTMMEKLKEKTSSDGQEAVIKSLNKRIDEILSRAEVTKTAKRKVKKFKTLIKTLTGKQSDCSTPATKVGKPSKKVKTGVKVKDVKPQQKKEQQKKKVKPEDDEDDSDEVEEDLGDLDDGEENDDQSSVAEEEEDENDDDDVDEEEDEDSEEEVPQTTNKIKSNKAKVPQPKKALIEMEAEEDEDEEGTDAEEEEEELKTTKPQKNNANIKKPVISNGDSSKKTRYVLFVGNLAYNTTKAELEEHFKKAGNVVDVRIPTDRATNKPRGFAYVELSDKDGYEKAIGLNDSQLKNRKIHVEYTQTGKKDNSDKKAIKAKTFKLQAMQKKGQFNRGFNKQNKK